MTTHVTIPKADPISAPFLERSFKYTTEETKTTADPIKISANSPTYAVEDPTIASFKSVLNKTTATPLTGPKANPAIMAGKFEN